VVRGAVRIRGVATAVIAKRMAPSTLAERNGEYWLLERLGPEVRVVVDVGANVGDWSARAIESFPALERLICFEPGTWAADELQKRLGGDARVDVVRRAVGDRRAEVTFWEEPHGGTMSSGVAGHSSSSAIARTVETVTLDEELRRLAVDKVDLLKVDAEGLDLHVLRGVAGLLRANAIDVIQFEYTDAWQDAGSTLRAAYTLLADAGYRTMVLTSAGLRDFPLRSFTELFVYANFVAVSSESITRFQPFLPSW
jgi:FkbM family methyltransferase